MRRLLLISVFFQVLIFTTLFGSNTDRVFYSGNENLSNNLIDSIFVINGIASSIDSILAVYCKSGYPFAEINIDSAVKKGDIDFYYMHFNENGRYSISSIVNNEIVKSGFLNGVLKLNGRQFNKEHIDDMMKELKKYDFIAFNSAYSIEKNSDSTVVVLTNIGQKRSSSIAGALSTDFDTMIIAGYLDLSVVSPFGNGDRYLLNYSRFSKDYSKIKMYFEYPFVMSTQLGLMGEGDFSNIDSTLLNGNIKGGIFAYAGLVKISTAFGRSFINYVFTPDSNESYYTLSGEISYNNGKNFKSAVLAEENISNDLWTRLSLSANARITPSFAFIDIDFITKNNFIENYIRYMGFNIGGNENLKGFPDNFLNVADYEFIEVRSGFSGFVNFKPGIFFDAASYRQEIIEKYFDNFIYSYGLYLNAKAQNTEMILYYAINTMSEALNGRIHFSLGYSF